MKFRQKQCLYLFLTFVKYVICDGTNNHAIQIPETKVQESCMVDNCHGGEYRQKLVEKSLKVYLLKHTQKNQEIDCSVTYAARRPGQRLLITFDDLAVCDDKDGSCGLSIYDGNDDQVRLTKVNGYYEKGVNVKNGKELSELSFISTLPALTLMYEGTPTVQYNGFTAILTVIEKPYINGTCGPDFFHCTKDKYCIAEQLQCNGYRNCEDGSDEDKCVILPDHTGFQQNPGAENLGMLVGGSISILILLIVAVWLGIVCVRKIMTKREFERREHMMVTGPVIDADHAPPIIHCPQTGRRRLPPLQTSMHEPPPLYSEHTGHGRLSQYELPPPYTPDGCDTAGLLNQTQGLSLDTPPIYQTIDPHFERRLVANNSRDETNLQYTYTFPESETVDAGTSPIDGGGLIAPVHAPPVRNDNTNTRPEMVSNFCQVGDSLPCISFEYQQQETGSNDNIGNSDTASTFIADDESPVERNNNNMAASSPLASPLSNANASSDELGITGGTCNIQTIQNCLLSDSIEKESRMCPAPINHTSAEPPPATTQKSRSSSDDGVHTSVNYFRRPAKARQQQK